MFGNTDFCSCETAGWVPVEKSNRQYCWHSSVVDYEVGAALVLQPSCDDEDMLEITAVPLADLQEQTLELIGTSVNGNPYGEAIQCLSIGLKANGGRGAQLESSSVFNLLVLFGLGSKKQPVHCLVPHGSIQIRNPPPVNFQQLCSWFQESSEGRVEGIVWHCNDGTLIKVGGVNILSSSCPETNVLVSIHRHHLGLRWPDGETCLANRPVVIRLEGTIDTYSSSKGLLSSFFPLNGHRFSRLQDVEYEL
ncbi:hypothetical protein GOODEAATRI_031525 [Goodea atripinnis]|uniref:RNA ligase 1 n=1 Tax=Goodea atripinnis TaxID=208336 RepID=A0ABV0MWS1_9TELE